MILYYYYYFHQMKCRLWVKGMHVMASLIQFSCWCTVDEKEITRLKSDLARNKEKLTRALEYKADREELKDKIRKSKEAIALQKEETEQVRKDLDDERHDLKMAQ